MEHRNSSFYGVLVDGESPASGALAARGLWAWVCRFQSRFASWLMGTSSEG